MDYDVENVEHPAHYKKNGTECIDWIKEAMTEDEFRGYLKGNALKYIWRYENKGKPVEDLMKARWYLEQLAEEMPC